MQSSVKKQQQGFGWVICAMALASAGCAAEPSDPGTTQNNVNMAAGAGGIAGANVNPAAGIGGASGVGAGGASGAAGMSAPIGGVSGGAAGDASGAGMGAVAGMTGGELMCADAPPKEGLCKEKAEGVYAIKTEIDVWWKDNGAGLLGQALVDPGRDKITVYMMGELTDVCPDGSGGQGTIKGCGTVLPAFRSDANCDSFEIQFPSEMWDQPTMPSFVTTGSTTGFNPNDILTLNVATGMIGIALDDQNGAWPTYMETGSITCPAGTGEQCFPDHDGDGRPGITVKMGRLGETDTAAGPCGGFGLPFVFRGAPLDGGPSALVDDGIKADTIFIGLRIRLGGAGAIAEDCNSGVGDSPVEMLDNRVWGCTQTDGMECPLAAASFVDSVSPVYHILQKDQAPPTDVLRPTTQGGGPLDQTPSRGGRSALVRIGDLGQTFACDAVRNAAYPEL